jgi:hypothetical protein
MQMDRTVVSQHVLILLVLVYVIYTLTSAPDDDRRMGSKRVGLVYRDCNISEKNNNNNKSAFVWLSVLCFIDDNARCE